VPRLVYADWLDENAGDDSQRARSEFIRVQVELARLPGDDPRFDGLEAREAELSKAWQKKWWAAMPKGCKRGYFHRGFPVGRLDQFGVAGLARLDEERLCGAPLWRYHYGATGTELEALRGRPCLHRLDLFSLRPVLPHGWVDWLVGADGPRNASELA